MAGKMRDIMSPAPVSMPAGESVSAAARAMKERGIGAVLVVADGKLSGLHRRSALADISAAPADE
jgi:CBS domain-containing protein